MLDVYARFPYGRRSVLTFETCFDRGVPDWRPSFSPAPKTGCSRAHSLGLIALNARCMTKRSAARA